LALTIVEVFIVVKLLAPYNFNLDDRNELA
jgi:hypothetical protein